MMIPLAFFAATLLPAPQEWTQFRGPNGTGISAAKGIPVQWTEQDFRWRVALPGDGHSQPVIWGDKIFLECARDAGRERMVVCLNKVDGKELWVKRIPMATHIKNKDNSYASSTPAVDADRVYALFADTAHYLVKAFDHYGEEVWSVDLGPFSSQHGMGTSPILFEGKLIVPNDQDGESFIVALEAKSGKTAWKSPRRPAVQGTAYGIPRILERKGVPPELLLTSRAHGISSLDARTGKPLWEAVIFDKRSVSSPVVCGDLVIGTCGQGGGAGNFLAAVRLGGKGDVTASHLAYKLTRATPYVPTPLAVGDRLFLMSDIGVASCVEASTGRVIWSERVEGGFYSSPVLIDGKIYCPSRKGECVVLEAADQFKILSRSPLGEGSHATPCVDADRVYFRTFTHLVCVGKK